MRSRAVHRRTWEMDRAALRIVDHVSGSFHTAEARFHLHPAVTVESREGESIVLQVPRLEKVALCMSGGRWRVEPATWHPEFGRSEETLCLVAEFATPQIETTITWSELD